MVIKNIIMLPLWILLVSFSFYAPRSVAAVPWSLIQTVHKSKTNTCTICEELKADIKSHLYLTECAIYEFETYDPAYAQRSQYWQIIGKKAAFEVIYDHIDKMNMKD